MKQEPLFEVPGEDPHPGRTRKARKDQAIEARGRIFEALESGPKTGRQLAEISVDYDDHIGRLRYTNRILVESDDDDPGNTVYTMIPFNIPKSHESIDGGQTGP